MRQGVSHVCIWSLHWHYSFPVFKELEYQKSQPPQPGDKFVSVVSQFITVASFSFSDVEDLLAEAKDLVSFPLVHWLLFEWTGLHCDTFSYYSVQEIAGVRSKLHGAGNKVVDNYFPDSIVLYDIGVFSFPRLWLIWTHRFCLTGLCCKTLKALNGMRPANTLTVFSWLKLAWSTYLWEPEKSRWWKPGVESNVQFDVTKTMCLIM